MACGATVPAYGAVCPGVFPGGAASWYDRSGVPQPDPDQLSPRHRRFLAERAVGAAFAEARSYRTIENPRTVARITKNRKLKPPGLAIPIYGLLDMELTPEEDELRPSYAQYRPDRPYRSDDGKVLKYINPMKSHAVVDVNPRGFESQLWLDRDVPLFVVEGVPKGDALWTAELPAVSIQGVWNFTTSGAAGFRELLGDLRYLPLDGRAVVVAFDADAWTNPDVRAAARELGRVLGRRASEVLALRLPDPEAKTGVDDYLARGHDNPRAAVLDLAVSLEELAGRSEVRLTALSDVEARPVEFLWEPYLPRGELAFLEGIPGVGKSYVALAIAAAVTRGGALPTALQGQEAELSKTAVPKGRVVYFTNENSPSASLRPRFDALGGDPTRLLFEDASAEVGISVDDIDALRRVLVEVQPTLVVFDPLMNYVQAEVDIHRENEVRALTKRLGALSRETGTTILGIRHLKKAAGGPAVYAGVGSVGFAAAARSVLIAATREIAGRGEVTVVAHAKSSDAPRGTSLVYDIHTHGKDDRGFYVSSFEWRGGVDVRADDLVAAPGPRTAPKRERLEHLLRQLLDANPKGVPKATIEAAVTSSGASMRLAQEVANALGVEKEAGIWRWAGEPQPARKRRRKASRGGRF